MHDHGDVMQRAAERRAARFGFIGFGALAQAFAAGLRDGGAGEIAVLTRPRGDPAAAEALAGRLLAARVRSCSSIEDAVAGADVIIAAVPAVAAGRRLPGPRRSWPRGRSTSTLRRLRRCRSGRLPT
jgi:predicted dinucleotide-binding enzyme